MFVELLLRGALRGIVTWVSASIAVEGLEDDGGVFAVFVVLVGELAEDRPVDGWEARAGGRAWGRCEELDMAWLGPHGGESQKSRR